MSDRPTPEEIMRRYMRRYIEDPRAVEWALESFARHGYVIVHPDDMRARDEAIIEATLCHFDPNPLSASRGDIDSIIAAAEQGAPDGD
jgi:N-acetyl-anhydromuramyl-L-alanine amidase AmpD